MMLPQVFTSAFILLLPVASGSFPEVYGMGGEPVTLPCSYPESRALSFVCWSRGECASDTCGQTVVWTDGNRINYRTSSRYQINSQLLQGNASLTIQDAYESDSGLYCCRVEMKGWDGVQTLTTSLQVQPGSNSARTKGLAIGLSIFLLLLVLVSSLVVANYILMKKRPGSQRNSVDGSQCTDTNSSLPRCVSLPQMPNVFVPVSYLTW